MSYNHLKEEEDNLSNKDISISLDNLGQKYSGLKPIKKPTISELPLPDICNFISVFEEDETPFIFKGGTTLEEPISNINKESDLEEETKVVKEVEENI
ncbi:hypothetical protein CWI38_2670p0010 [Hamiltosporidium tvaerminnensis]|uniref:Uncharacterized protein n=1 Tax=Hamiltosporidium tvaerminnensis TaxID=1176355 RepID=A0A4Q9LDB3_9MICR|nr:hypothetical protein CWI38_2670p0010 [Hamiltosporidium tvaerminnensis]